MDPIEISAEDQDRIRDHVIGFLIQYAETEGLDPRVLYAIAQEAVARMQVTTITCSWMLPALPRL